MTFNITLGALTNILTNGAGLEHKLKIGFIDDSPILELFIYGGLMQGSCIYDTNWMVCDKLTKNWEIEILKALESCKTLGIKA